MTRFVLSSDIAITIVFFSPSLFHSRSLSLSFIFIFLPRKIYNRHAESSLEGERERTLEKVGKINNRVLQFFVFNLTRTYTRVYYYRAYYFLHYD